MHAPSWPSEIQCMAAGGGAAARSASSGNVSSLRPITVTSCPAPRAASSTRNGKRPLPAISPSFTSVPPRERGTTETRRHRDKRPVTETRMQTRRTQAGYAGLLTRRGNGWKHKARPEKCFAFPGISVPGPPRSGGVRRVSVAPCLCGYPLLVGDDFLCPPRRAAQDDAALGGADELDQVLHLGACERAVLLYLLQRARRVQLRLQEVAERSLQLRDHVLREASSHEADRVCAVDARGAAADRARVRQCVLRHHRVAADERVAAEAAELVDARAGADVDEIFHRHVAAERRRVAEDRVVNDVAVVRHVHGHPD